MSWEGAPGPRRRAPVLLAGVTAAAVVIAAAVALTTRDPGPAPLTVTATREPAAAPGGEPAGDLQPAQDAPDAAGDITGDGPLLPDAPALTIVTADFGSQLQVIDVASGDLRNVRLFTERTFSRPERLQVVGGTLFLDTSGDVVRLRDDPWRPEVVARGRRTVVTAATDTLWTYDGGAADAGGEATRIAFDGTVRDRVTLPTLTEPLAGTAERLLVRTPGSVVQIAPGGARREVARGLALASDGTRLARLDCVASLACRVAIGTVDEPDRVQLALAPDDQPVGLHGDLRGRFSPDGQWLALPLFQATRAGDITTATVAVIDTTLGAEVARLPASPLTRPHTPFAWSPDSRWLIASTGTGLQAWGAAGGDVVDLPIRLLPTYALAVL